MNRRFDLVTWALALGAAVVVGLLCAVGGARTGVVLSGAVFALTGVVVARVVAYEMRRG